MFIQQLINISRQLTRYKDDALAFFIKTLIEVNELITTDRIKGFGRTTV